MQCTMRRCACCAVQVTEEAKAAVQGVRESLGLARFESVRVKHCAHAFGLCLAGPQGAAEGEGWKMVFSADTRPCEALVEAAKGATLLIHEVRCPLHTL